MASRQNIFSEHNSACERAKFSGCNCYCRGAGHQIDVIKRAVSCTLGGKNNYAQLLADLTDIYGGFHNNFLDITTPTRRPHVDDIGKIPLDKGKGASWSEKMLVDEALHAAFIYIADSSVLLTNQERDDRLEFIDHLSSEAFRIIRGDTGARNIRDGHIWCSIVAEACSLLPTIPSTISPLSKFGKIAYPRNKVSQVPRGLDQVRVDGVMHIRTSMNRFNALPAKEDLIRLMGAAACPDLWHHPAAVRYSLYRFVSQSGWAPKGSTKLAIKPGIHVLDQRWGARGLW